MNHLDMRNELHEYYWTDNGERAENFCQMICAQLDRQYSEDMSAYEMKMMQYQAISEAFQPVIFKTVPFYYETGTMFAQTDGSRDFHGHRHAGGWTYWKNAHKFIDQDPELWELQKAQQQELFYTVGAAYEDGGYNDQMQHFNFNYRPILSHGLKTIYEKAVAGLKNVETREEELFLQSVCTAMLAMKKMSEKFAAKATELMETETDKAVRNNYSRIAEAASRTPWSAPQNLYEALNTLAFMRKAFGTLDGVGPNTFGRIDLDLYPFYEKDIAENRITKEEAYDLICKFLLVWDQHYDHDMKMVGYADHELENTYVLGGCDAEGHPVCNDLTLMFLRASREEVIIVPKITCRYSKNSPKEYLDEANRAVVNGTSTLLFQNDDASIPAMLRQGRTIEEARDYIITGCWAIMGNGMEKIDDGCYVNILKVMEYMLHNRTAKMEKVGMQFELIDQAESFEEIYHIYCANILKFFEERARVVRAGGNIWNTVDPQPIFSSTLKYCIENKKDYTAGGAKYRDSRYELVGFPNVLDSLLAIRELCYVKKQYTLTELLQAIRCNWEGFENMRLDALRCHGWGDGSKETSELARRFMHDLFTMADQQVGTYGGKVFIGHFTYTEIVWWGKQTLATPDGRRNGEYISQGLTPSRLKKIPAVTSVINNFSELDSSEIRGNSVVNIILPNHISLEHCEAFLRAVAGSSVQSLQLNCTSLEQLRDAQVHPEKYPELIVRVCGFSAKFTSLSREYQEEVISRNFYE